jgi:hypothetical protein
LILGCVTYFFPRSFYVFYFLPSRKLLFHGR